MAKGSHAFFVARPPAEVFAYVADLERAPEWVPDLVSVTKKSPGEVGVGTRYQEVVQMGKRRGEAEIVVTEYEPPERFAHEGHGGPARFSARFTLTPHEGGTRVRHDYEVHMSGAFVLMGPLVARWVRKNGELAVENLKRTLERGG